MGDIISILQEIFMGKENNTFKVGLSEYKQRDAEIRHPNNRRVKKHKPQELRISELMRRPSY
jgi:hypothetical protein